MRLDISRSSVMALGLTAALAAAACGDDTGGGGGSGGSSGSSGSATTGASTGGGSSSSAASTANASSSGNGGGNACDSLCDTYGGAVPAVVDQIVTDALADPMFQDDFQPIADAGADRVALFKTNLVNFISDAYGCTEGAYDGPSMEAAHAGQGITSDEYDAFVQLCAGSLVTSGVPEDYVTECFAPGLTASALKSSIVGQ